MRLIQKVNRYARLRISIQLKQRGGNSMHFNGVGLGPISVSLPELVVTNSDLARAHPGWRMELVESKTGVNQRHIAGTQETALDLAEVACLDLLAANEGLLECIDGIIFCTQTPDYIMTPNACLLQERLGLGDEVMAFDTNLACSGYIYSLVIAQGLIASDMCTNILVVTADTYSKLINLGDRSARSLFGDGAAATWISRRPDATIVDAICETAGSGYCNFYVPAGGMRQPSTFESHDVVMNDSGNQRSLNDIHMNGMGVLSFANTKVPNQIRRLLERNA